MNIILLCLTFTVFIFAVRLIGNRPHFRTIWEELYAYQSKLHSATPRAITRLLLVQLFPNCTQMRAIIYTNFVTLGAPYERLVCALPCTNNSWVWIKHGPDRTAGPDLPHKKPRLRTAYKKKSTPAPTIKVWTVFLQGS